MFIPQGKVWETAEKILPKAAYLVEKPFSRHNILCFFREFPVIWQFCTDYRVTSRTHCPPQMRGRAAQILMISSLRRMR